MRRRTQEFTQPTAIARLVSSVIALAVACGGGDSATGAVGKSVTRVELTIPDSTMLVGDSLIAEAAGFDSSGSPVPDASVRWSSSDGNVVLGRSPCEGARTL